MYLQNKVSGLQSIGILGKQENTQKKKRALMEVPTYALVHPDLNPFLNTRLHMICKQICAYQKNRFLSSSQWYDVGIYQKGKHNEQNLK